MGHSIGPEFTGVFNHNGPDCDITDETKAFADSVSHDCDVLAWCRTYGAQPHKESIFGPREYLVPKSQSTKGYHRGRLV